MSGLDLFGFGPDAAVAAALDVRVRGELANSLSEIVDAIGADIGFTAVASATLIGALRRGPVRPAVFGLYTDLVVAAFRDDVVEASAIARQLGAPSEISRPGIIVANLTDDDLGPGQAARYRRFLDEGDLALSTTAPVDPAEQFRAIALIDEALALLDEATPEIGAELRAVVREVVLVNCVAPPDDKEALVLDGASTFYLWGAMFLNSARQRDRVSMAVALVHEAAHGLLFGMTLGAPLVANDPQARYPSPLRHDPRPMDGLAHATYVLARMIGCLEELLAANALAPDEVTAARATLAKHRADFVTGLAVVDAAADFKPDGAAAFAAMRRAMVPATVAA